MNYGRPIPWVLKVGCTQAYAAAQSSQAAVLQRFIECTAAAQGYGFYHIQDTSEL